MALVVEDGTGKADAESFATVPFFKDYFGARNVVVTTYTDPQIEGALRVATEYVETQFVDRWQGAPTTDEQALSWPRSGVVPAGRAAILDDDLVPTLVQRATAEIALLALKGQLYSTSSTPAVVVQETVGPITTKYATGAVVGTGIEQPLQKIDALLAPFFENKSLFPLTAARG